MNITSVKESGAAFNRYVDIFIGVSILFAIGTCTGCNGINRLIGQQSNDGTYSQVISSLPDTGQAPEFNLPAPSGTTRLVYFGRMPNDGKIQIKADGASSIKVFIKDLTVNQWFVLGDEYSDAFFYSTDLKKGEVRYYGDHLENKAYCVYQYVAVP